MSMTKKTIEIMIALIVLGALGGTALVGLSGLNLTDVGGINLSWVIILIGLGVFAGFGFMALKHYGVI